MIRVISSFFHSHPIVCVNVAFGIVVLGASLAWMNFAKDPFAVTVAPLPVALADVRNPQNTLHIDPTSHGDSTPPFHLINFWASWCKICPEETPYLTSLARLPGLKTIGIATFDDLDHVLQSPKLSETSYVMALDPDGETARRFGVNGLPQTFVIDSTGQIIYRVKGRLFPHHVTQISHIVAETLSQTAKL